MINELDRFPINLGTLGVTPYSGMTELELLNQYYIKINELVNFCNDTNILSNKALEFMEWCKNEGIPIETVKVVNEKILDGTLGRLINEVLLANINNKVDETKTELINKINTDIEKIKNENIRVIDEQLKVIGSNLESFNNKEIVKLSNSDFNVNVIDECNILKLVGSGLNNITGRKIIWNNKDKVHIKDINFNDMYGLFFYGCDIIKIENCTFTNFANVGIWAQDFKLVEIINCEFDNMGHGIARTSNERLYLGGAFSGNTGEKLIFKNNKVNKVRGQGAVQPVKIKEIYCDYNYFNKTDMRAFSLTQSGVITNGSVSFNIIENCGVYNTEPYNNGVGCNAIFGNGKTNLTVNNNIIKNVVENGIEIECLEICNNTIENTGLLQSTMPTPSTEGIWASAKKIINNTIVNAHQEPIRIANDSPIDIIISNNTLVKGENSQSDSAIASYGKGFNDSIINGNIIKGYKYVLYTTETLPNNFTGKTSFKNNATNNFKLKNGGHYPNLKIDGDLIINVPFITKESITKDEIKLGNVGTPTDTINGLQVTSINEYDEYIYKEISSKYDSSIIEVECQVMCEGSFGIRVVPYLNDEYDYSNSYSRDFESNGVSKKAHFTSVINYKKFKIEIVNRQYASGKIFTIKYFNIKYSEN